MILTVTGVLPVHVQTYRTAVKIQAPKESLNPVSPGLFAGGDKGTPIISISLLFVKIFPLYIAPRLL
jgi:hypothetical protein